MLAAFTQLRQFVFQFWYDTNFSISQRKIFPFGNEKRIKLFETSMSQIVVQNLAMGIDLIPAKIVPRIWRNGKLTVTFMRYTRE